MPIAQRRTLAFLVAMAAIPGVLRAADAHRWTVGPEDVTFEVTAADVRAWRGASSGPPAFSAAAIVADRKMAFFDSARERARSLAGQDPDDVGVGVSEGSVRIEVLSIVGPLLAYRDSSEDYAAGAAHPISGQRVVVRDLSRPEASPRLTDLFPEKQVVAALKADRWVRRFASADGEFARARTTVDLLATLNPSRARNWDSDEQDCTADVSFDDSFGTMFYFHHVEKDRVAVRIVVPPGSEWCNRAPGPVEIGILLPIPQGLRAQVEKAGRGEAGFLAANRAAFGALEYEGSWEAALKDMIPTP
jgi:hypothetical protein